MASFEDLRKRAKGEQSSSGSGTSFDELRSRAKQEKFDEDVSKVDDSYIKIYTDAASRYLNTAQERYDKVGFGNASSAYQIQRDTMEDLEYRRSVISKYLERNKDRIDAESYKSFSDSLNRFSADASSVLEAFSGKKDYFGQWDTEDEYLAWKDYDDKSKFDLEKGQSEIDSLEALLDEYRNLTRWMTDEKGEARAEAIRQQYGGEKGIKDLISQKKQYLNQARYIQEGIQMAGVTGNEDFGALSGYVTTKTSDDWWSRMNSQYGMGYDDLVYEYINGSDNGMRRKIRLEPLATPQMDEFSAYDNMTEDQIAIYNYHYAKDGRKAAEKYLNSIRESLNLKVAQGKFAKMEGNTALELLFGIEAGFDQFESGMRNLLNAEDDYIAQTAVQMASGMVREDLADVGPKLPKWLGGASLGQVGYDATTTMTNMAPSVLSSMAIGTLNPVAGAVTGNSMMFASAAGNAYQEALNLGYDKGQARTYSTLVGASEAGLQYLLGGISAMGGKVSGDALGKVLSGIDNGFARTALQLGGNMLSEGVEEGLQEILTPLFKQWTLRIDEDINWSEVAYSGLLGALTAGVMEGPSTIGGEVNTYRTGNALREGGITAQRLAEIGSTFAADTVAYQLAGRVNENTGAYTMGRLFNEIGATLTEQNVSEITEALVAKGMDRETAKKNARAMAVVVEGGNLTDRQVAIIEANEILAEAVRTTIIDSNATWFQRIKGYNEALMALAEEKTAPKDTEAEQPLPGQENADDADNMDAQNETGSEAIPGAKVVSVSSIQNGVATVRLEDGSEAMVREVDLDPDEGVRIETIAGIEGITSQDANFILGTLKAAPGASAQMDALGAKEAYKYGYYGFSQEHITKHGVFANSLNETQRQAIYETGRKARQTQVAKATPRATGAKNAQAGKVHFDGDRSALTERQSASLSAMEKVAEALGVQIHVFESKVGENGKRIGANGWYDPKDNSIHIDLHAGAKGEGTMLFTLAHELTHHIRKWSPAKFKILADFLMEEYGKKGVNVDGLVREQMNKAKRNGRTISYDVAFEEVVADSMETMLSDGKVVEKLAKLKAKDKALWTKIKNFIRDLAAKIRSVYEGMSPDSVEGRYVAEMVDSIERLQELFTEALVDASENYQSSLTPGEEGVVVNENGEPVAYSTDDGSVLLSMRTYEEEGREAFRKYLQKCVSSKKLTKAEMQEMLDGIEEIYQVCKDFKDKYAPFSAWSDAAVVRDTRGRPVFTVVTPNGDYTMNLDFSLVCKKRRTLDAVFNEMSRRGIIDDFELGQKSVVKINEIIRKYGLETACALCFVDAKRFRQASMADSFTRLYNELVESLVPEDQKDSIDHFNFSGYETIEKVDNGIHTWDASKLDFTHLDEVMKNYGKGTVEHKAAKYIKSHAEGRRLLLRGDFMSSHGFDTAKAQNQSILKLYNSKKGAGGPKAAFGDVQYMNEIIRKERTWTPAKAYAVGGIRIQSFSDYVPRMVFDYVQMIYDLAATRLPAHAFTKEPLFVKQFGLAGVKINMSLIPAIAEGGIAPGLDANGDYVWAGESFDYETAKEIQNSPGYTENCGTICVGVSRKHIEKLLDDPNIRMVIPYHKSGLNPIVAHMNKIAEFTDYTHEQNTTVKETGAKAEKHFDFNKALHEMGKNADPKAAIQQYFDWCDKNGYVPKFNDFRYHPNYYKLIEDFTLYDKDGNYVPQREVRAVFPKETDAFGSMKELIREGLQEDAVVEGKRDARLKAIVDEILRAIPKTEAEISEEQVAQADRDLEAEGLKLSDRDYMDAVNRGDMDAAQRMVDEAAKAAGYSVKGFHATNADFTVFDIDKTSDDNAHGKGFYFTNTRSDMEQNYANHEGPDPWEKVEARAYELAEEKYGLSYDDTLDSDPDIIDQVNECYDEAIAEFQSSLRRVTAYLRFENPLILKKGEYTDSSDYDLSEYDGIIDERVYETFGHSGMDEGTVHYVVFNPRNIKSAEAVTYDDNGKVIPLSRRFDAENLDIRYSIREDIVDVNGVKYDHVVELDYKTFNRVSRGVKDYINFIRANLINKKITVYNKNGDPEVIEFARENERVKKDGSSSFRRVLGELERATGDIRKLVIVNADEAVKISELKNHSSKNDHQWLDEHGWDERWSYVMTKDGMVYPAIFHIAKARDGRNILYGVNVDITKGVGIDKGATSARAKKLAQQAVKIPTPSGKKLSQPGSKVKKFSDRDSDSVSNRSLLANAFDGVVQNDIERRKLGEYKSKISLIEAEEKKLSDLNEKIKELSSGKGKRDARKINGLRFEAQQTANRISIYDQQLLRLEASKPLRDVLSREKKAAYDRAKQKGKEAMDAYRLKAEVKQSEILRDYRETRAALRQQKSDTAVMEKEFVRIAKAYEKLEAKSTAKSVKDAKTIADLKAALKEEALKHRDDQKTWEAEFNRLVREYEASGRSIAKLEEKIERQKASAKARVEGREKTAMRHKIQGVVKELNDLLLNESKTRHVPDSLKRAVADALALVNMDTVGAEERAAKYANLIAKEQAKADPDQAKIDSYTMTMENILGQGEKMGQRLKELRDAYEEIQQSDDPDIANAYDPVIAGNLNELAQTIGNTSLRNMTIEQLSDVYDMYRMVLTRVRDANKTFLKGKSESISNLASRVVGEVRRVGGEHTYRAAILDPVRKFLWNNLKPVYAMEYIGSDALTEVFNGVRQGEDTWAKDVTEARAYYLEKSKKYGYDRWDFKKKYRFESDSGIPFELTLEQILSLYAYSKRDQAHDHLRLGGFVFDSNIETTKEKGKLKYKVNTADAHQITTGILADIIGKLSAEQKSFVDEMQDYLSTTMGAKGNEVTMAMYGVKLFKEKFYFPLKSAKQFMFEQNEVSGEVRIKNSGFTNKTVAKANNPVILSNFMEVWAGHVNDMSMYHAFVLPLEDFNRVFNYNSPKREGQPPVSVKGTIQNAYSPAAVSYVKNLITDLNGGARTDSTTGIINKMMGLFKKGSVFASLSVVVQQPSAIARAAALIDTKYFIGPKVDRKRHKLLWDEVKQYAPVAIIKEMGYFDTNMGKSTQDFIIGKEYSGFAAKMKALVTDSGYRDEILSKAPALADELAWCSIWEAVKREMHDKHKGLDIKTEPFLMLAGARFTEVITKTQVYDSVLSRSAHMRSKDTGMKMATAFMAEPTTAINMVTDALLQGKRGRKKYTRSAIGAVIASQIFNSILVSFVYAGRDDDEDKTYLEKYIENLTGNALDSLNPAGYIPFLKDIMSIVQGYDVERSDMAVISDLWNAWQKLGSDKLSTYRKVEGFAGSIAQIFGLPVKNIMRDARGIYQTVDSFMGGQQTTKAGIGYAVKSALPEWMGGGDVANHQQLYEAILSGDKAQIERVKSRYQDQDAVSTAIRKALRENDPRVKEAALAQINGDPSERVRIARLIIADGFSQDDVVRAINAEINAMAADESDSGTKKEKGFYTASDFAREIANGDQAAANAAKTDIIRTAEKNGKTAEEAEKSFNSSAKSELKELFLAGEISEQKVIQALVDYCGIDSEDAKADAQYWAYKQDYPDVYADDSWFDKYYEDVADSGISIDQYMKYRNQVKDITGEGKKERRMAVIDALPISSAQKDALYYAEGWAESKLYEAPWH